MSAAREPRTFTRGHFAGLFGLFLVLFFMTFAMLGYGADHHLGWLAVTMALLSVPVFGAGLLALLGVITPPAVNRLWGRSEPGEIAPPRAAPTGAGPSQIERQRLLPDEASFPALVTLGEDLILLSPLSKSGSINTPSRLNCGLRGSELVRLVAGGYVDIVKGRIERLDVPRAPADPNLDEALNSIRKSPKAKGWVAQAPAGIGDSYLRRLEDEGVVRSETSKSLRLFTTTRWYIVDARRSAAVRHRLDDIVAGHQGLGLEDRSLAGLAYALGLGPALYPGRQGKLQRETLKQIARPKKPGPFGRRADETPDPMDAATSASIDAAHQAAIDAAVQAAIDQAVGAAVDAAIGAAVDAGSGGGDGGGGHHG